MIGASTLTGVIYLEAKKSTFSKLFQELGNSISVADSSGRGSVQGSSTDGNFSNSVNSLFLSLQQEITTLALSFWAQLNALYTWFFSLAENDGKKGKLFLEGVQKFFKSWWDWEIVRELVENLHLKFKNIVLFAFDPRKRETFGHLLSQGKWNQTLDAIKTLLGLTLLEHKNSLFKVEDTLFSFLILKFLDNPEKVSKKFQRFSEKIVKGLKDSSGSNGSVGEQKPSGEGKVYKLTKKTLGEWLDVEEGGEGEILWEILWKAEILSTLSAGEDLTFGAKKVVVLGQKLFNAVSRWWDKLLKKGSR